MIVLREVTLRRGAKLLLDRASLTLQPGEKAGLVGRNGAGKSSLFSLLAGRLHEDGGDCSVPAHWRVAEVSQNLPECGDSATDFVQDGDTRLAALRQALAEAEAGDASDGMALAQLHADLGDAGAHDAQARAQALILGLGFQPHELDQPVDSFSGGWRMRLQLARALMAPSDLLLLDEPTNHLDLDALVWLEGWLQRYAGTLVVISHDREFLDAVTGVTVHIEQQRLARYGGNYSAFELLRAQQLAQQQAAHARQQERIAHLQKFIDRFKAKATKARQAQSRVKALERMERVAPVLADAEFTFDFRAPLSLPNPMLAITAGVFGYPPASDDVAQADPGSARIVLRNVNRSVLAGQRIGILGANGQGKSTLVKTIAHALPLQGGQLTEGKGLTIGYFAQQELDVLRPQDTPLEHMVRLAREQAGAAAREQDLRNFLGQFLFAGDMAHQPVGSLSGGEKARLALAMIVWQRPNLLLLDEPTNHLDLTTREALAMALNAFEGTVLLVSHDRALLRAVCDEFWLVARGAVTPFDGDLDDYQRYLVEEARRQREQARAGAAVASAGASSSASAQPSRAPAQPARAAASERPASTGRDQRRQEAQARQAMAERLRPIRQALQASEQSMARLGAEKAALEARLATPLDPAGLAEAGRRLKAVHDELAQTEERWLDLSQQLEAHTC